MKLKSNYQALPLLKTSKTDMTRRRFIRNLGLGAGAALLSPSFNPLSFANTPGVTAPKRFVLVLEGNSCEPVNFLSNEARSALESASGNTLGDARWFHTKYPAVESPLLVDTDFASAPALAALSTGGTSLVNKSRVLLGLSSTITGGSHSTFHGALGCNRSTSGNPAGQTIDVWLGQQEQVIQQTPFDVLRVGVNSSSNPLSYSTCAYDVGKAAALVLDPNMVFNALFGSVSSDPAVTAAFQERNMLLQFGLDDVDGTLGLMTRNPKERQKLETYQTGLQKLLNRQLLLQNMAGTLATHKPVDPNENPLYADSEDKLDLLRAQFELVTNALKAGLTNVAVVGSGTGYEFNMIYPSVNSQVARHDMHHGSADDSSLLADIHEITKLQVEMTIQLARDLDAIPEGNGTMLDHTVIVYMSDNGEQHHSSAQDWPMLVIGGGALGLGQGGKTLIYPHINAAPGHRQVSNFFNTLGYCAGVNLNDFGKEGPRRFKEGPLEHLLL